MLFQVSFWYHFSCLTLYFFLALLLAMDYLSLPSNQNVFFTSLNNIFAISAFWSILSTFKKVMSFLYGLCGSDESRSKFPFSFPQVAFKKFLFFSFGFQQFNSNMSGCGFIGVYPASSLLNVLNLV